MAKANKLNSPCMLCKLEIQKRRTLSPCLRRTNLEYALEFTVFQVSSDTRHHFYRNKTFIIIGLSETFSYLHVEYSSQGKFPWDNLSIQKIHFGNLVQALQFESAQCLRLDERSWQAWSSGETKIQAHGCSGYSRFRAFLLGSLLGLAAVTGAEVLLGGHHAEVTQLQLILLHLCALKLLLLLLVLLLLLQLAFDDFVKGGRLLPAAERVRHLEGIADDVVELFSLRGKRRALGRGYFDRSVRKTHSNYCLRSAVRIRWVTMPCWFLCIALGIEMRIANYGWVARETLNQKNSRIY